MQEIWTVPSPSARRSHSQELEIGCLNRGSIDFWASKCGTKFTLLMK